MANATQLIERSLAYLKSKSKEISLKKEQEEAVRGLLRGKDVIAVLPTGFGKSLIFTVFALAKKFEQEAIHGGQVSVLVVAPLKSIIEDQIAAMQDIECTAMELTPSTADKVFCDPPQFIYATAEQLLEKRFLEALKDKDSALHLRISAVVVDESHTVETWSGKRKFKAKADQHAFREAYGKLSVLRSMCKEGTPFMALTGTADKETQRTIIKELVMHLPLELFVSPNRTNIKFEVKKVKKPVLLGQLQWIVDSARKRGAKMPKTIIFCSTLNAIASVVNWLMMMLGSSAFVPSSSTSRDDCLIGIFHSLTLKTNKERISRSLKIGGKQRIVVATSALSMGVNFPDIRNVVMFGPARCILDFHQEAGRAGRDGNQSICTTYFYGQQVTHCEDDVRSFLKSEGCLRVGAYISLDPNITPLQPGHNCCTLCEVSCECDECKQTRASPPQEQEPTVPACREVTEEQYRLLEAALRELKGTLTVEHSPMPVFGDTSYGFSEELIEDVLSHSKEIFTISDILSLTPVFSTRHALIILEVFCDIFEDCDEGMEECAARIEQSLDSHIDLLLNSEYGLPDEVDDLNFDVL